MILADFFFILHSTTSLSFDVCMYFKSSVYINLLGSKLANSLIHQCHYDKPHWWSFVSEQKMRWSGSDPQNVFAITFPSWFTHEKENDYWSVKQCQSKTVYFAPSDCFSRQNQAPSGNCVTMVLLNPEPVCAWPVSSTLKPSHPNGASKLLRWSHHQSSDGCAELHK